MTRVADSSFVYAFFSEDDRHHAAAWRAVHDAEPIAVPSEILVESIDLIARRKGRAVALAALQDLLAVGHVRLAERAPFEGVRAAYEAGGGRLSLADAVVVQTCLVLGATALAYDQDILKALGE